MKHTYSLSIALLFVLLTGCAGTNVTVNKQYNYVSTDTFKYNIIDNANVTAQGMDIFKGRLKSKLDEQSLLSNNSNKIIEITFTNYYMRHGATRSLAGIMAGSDNITTTVLIKDKANGKVVGEIVVISKNPTAVGTAQGLIEGHADKIVSFIKTGKAE